MAININTVHLLHPKKEENGCLYCIKIHATAGGRKKRTKNIEEQKNRNPENRGKIPRAKTETNANIKPRKPTIDITVFSIAPCKSETRKKGGRKGDRRKQGSVFLAMPWSQNASK
jgi:hypothetical protein